MSSIVAIDLSTKALDLVKLEEEDSRAEWVRCELVGKTAWERTLTVRDSLLFGFAADRWASVVNHSAWWDDVLLVAIEAPYGHGSDLLNRVVGAITASLPAHLRVPHRCWIVRPDEWKTGLGLKGKADAQWWCENGPDPFDETEGWPQDARDAFCLALFARDENAKAAPDSPTTGTPEALEAPTQTVGAGGETP